MRVNESELNSSVLPRDPPAEGAPRRQPWVTSTLAAILIFTIAVDLLGNLLVILSVYRNKKLRNAGEPGTSFCALRDSGYPDKSLTQGRELRRSSYSTNSGF